MARLTKKQKEAVAKIEKDKLYSVEEASALIKKITNTKFDSSTALHKTISGLYFRIIFINSI